MFEAWFYDSNSQNALDLSCKTNEHKSRVEFDVLIASGHECS